MISKCLSIKLVNIKEKQQLYGGESKQISLCS